MGITLGAACLLGMAAQPAAASVSRCDREFSANPLDYKRLCMNVTGIALYVQDVQVTRNEPGSICNWRAAYVVYPRGRRAIKYKGRKHLGCSFVQASYTFHPKRNYPNHARICAFWYNDGKRQDAAPCATIERNP